MDINGKGKTIKLLGKKTDEKFFYVELDKKFLTLKVFYLELDDKFLTPKI